MSSSYGALIRPVPEAMPFRPWNFAECARQRRFIGPASRAILWLFSNSSTADHGWSAVWRNKG
jgi:hypothetical protein